MKKDFWGDIRPLTRPGADERKHPHVEAVERPVREIRTQEVHKPSHTPQREEIEHEEISYRPQTQRSGWSWSRITGVVIAALAIVGGGLYGLSFAFRGATVTVIPKTVPGTIELSLTAGQGEAATLHYEVMTIPQTTTREVTATHTDTSSMKAKGSVVLYNFQTTSQQLVATTRFADPSGAIFRLPQAVTIPKKTSAGPGQITVTLVADVGGPAGNIDLADFTVVAFKGTAKEKLVYGRSKTAFTGGTSGAVFFLTDEEHKAVLGELKAEAEAKLKDDVLKQIPEGYVLLPESLTFTPDTDGNSKNDPSQTATVTVTYTGKGRAILLKKDELETAFLKAVAPDETVDVSKVTFTGTESLAYSITTDLVKTPTPKQLAFTVKGDIAAVWKIDTDAVKNLLGGVKRSVFASIMQTVSSVERAELVLHPFWMSTLPTDTTKIDIVIR